MRPTPAGVVQLKSQLKLFSSLLPGLNDTHGIQAPRLLEKGIRIFPIKRPGQMTVELVDFTIDFVIADRADLAKSFSDKATMMYFSTDENRELLPLYSWLGIESRFISRCVREISTVDRTNLIPVSAAACKLRQNFKALGR